MEMRRNGFNLPVVTKNLLIINCLLWLATIVFTKVGIINLDEWLGLHYWRGSHFNAAQFITYMFMHDQENFMHLFFNMFSLWMFGVTLERVLGPKRFLFYYLTCGLGAAFIQEITWEVMLVQDVAVQNGLPLGQAFAAMSTIPGEMFDAFITVGASGAVFGILLAFGMLFPNLPMYIIPFPFPIKAKWMVIGYGVIELFCGIGGVMAGVAHFAHLGGMLFGFILILYWRKKGAIGGGNGFY